MKCLSCQNKLKIFLKVKNAPLITQVVTLENLKKDKKISLSIFKCQKCGLLQINQKAEPNRSYYEQYLIDRNCSTYFNDYQKHAAKDFVERFNLKNKRIIDVGCGDGFFAALLSKNGAIATGIDPSESACELTKKKGVKVIRGYVDNNLKINNKFNAFTLCQVLEHIRNPKDFLENIKNILEPNGYGFIEVPSLTKTLFEKRYSDFFPDHVAYYDSTSLSFLLQSAGFEIIDIYQSVNNEFLTAIVKSREGNKNENLQKDFTEYQKKANKFIKSVKEKKVIVWGAGIRGISVISYSFITDKIIKYCIDSDKKKIGFYLPGSHLKVVSPEILMEEEFDVVIITAFLYTNEIVKILRNKFNYKNKIAVLFPEPKYI